MTTFNEQVIYSNTIRETSEDVLSGIFTRVRSKDSDEAAMPDEYVYGYIDCPDCHPFKASILVGMQSTTPFLSFHNLSIVRQLQSFYHLQEGWDSYDSEKPSTDAIDQSISFIRHIDECGVHVYFVAPGPNGEILVELKKDDKAAEIYFYGDESPKYLLFPHQKEELTNLPNAQSFIRNIWLPFVKN